MFWPQNKLIRDNYTKAYGVPNKSYNSKLIEFTQATCGHWEVNTFITNISSEMIH